MKFTIRQAEPADAEAISHLVTSLARYFLSDPSSSESGGFLEGLTPSAYSERIASPKFMHYVTGDSAGLSGIIAMRDGSHIYHLFARQDLHRRGVARALWEHARAVSGHASFTVNSSQFAVPVYERFGFIATTSPQTLNGIVFVPMRYTHTI